MARKLFKNVLLFDGTGTLPYLGEALIHGNRIEAVARGRDQLDADGAQVVDGGGATLMPGLTEAHSHLSFTNCVNVTEMGDLPIEEHTLLTMKHAKLMLDCGFTSCFSAASAKPRLDIVVRNAIDAGDIPGPRLRAASPRSPRPAGWATCGNCSRTTPASRSLPTGRRTATGMSHHDPRGRGHAEDQPVWRQLDPEGTFRGTDVHGRGSGRRRRTGA